MYTLVPVFVPGENPPKPRFWKTTLLLTPEKCMYSPCAWYLGLRNNGQAKSKRGQEEGDGTETVRNCLKLPQICCELS